MKLFKKQSRDYVPVCFGWHALTNGKGVVALREHTPFEYSGRATHFGKLLRPSFLGRVDIREEYGIEVGFPLLPRKAQHVVSPRDFGCRLVSYRSPCSSSRKRGRQSFVR